MPGFLRPAISRDTPGLASTPNVGTLGSTIDYGSGGGNVTVGLLGKLLTWVRGLLGTQGGTSSGVVDAWTRVSPAGGTGPNMIQGWMKGSVRGNGELVINCGDAPSSWRFNFASGQWVHPPGYDPTIPPTIWWKTLGKSENYDFCYDSANDWFYRGNGGPFAYRVSVANDSPHYGEARYEPGPDEWFTYNPYGSVYVPVTPADSAHWNAAGTANNNVGMFDGVFEYHNGWVYGFSSAGSSAGTFKRVANSANARTVFGDTNRPPGNGSSKYVWQYRGGIDHRNGMLWVIDYVPASDSVELFVHYVGNGIDSKWTQMATTGNKPSTVPTAGYTEKCLGLMADLDETNNCIVVWCSNSFDSSGTGQVVRQTWVLDLTTMIWRGPVSTPNIPPGGVITVQQSLCYNKARGATDLMIYQNPGSEVWEFTTQSPGSKWYAFPLPTSTGGVVGSNYYGFPFTANGSSKQSCMCYCPMNGRLYAGNGDTSSSAVDIMTSMDFLTGGWQVESTRPVYPTSPAPHALQDGYGFAWMPSRNKFILWPGSYSAYTSYDKSGDTKTIALGSVTLILTGTTENDYAWRTASQGGMAADIGNTFRIIAENAESNYMEGKITAVVEGAAGTRSVTINVTNVVGSGTYSAWRIGDVLNGYAGGVWFFDPVTKVYEQFTQLFGNKWFRKFADSTSGMNPGGIYDPQSDCFFALNGSGSPNGTLRSWSVASMSELTPYTFAFTRTPEVPSGNQSVYCAEPKPVLIGRQMFFLTRMTHDGINYYAHLWSIDLDTHQLRLAPTPPAEVHQTMKTNGEFHKLAQSHGKVIWFCIQNPDGVLLQQGIYIYDPNDLTWSVDSKRPGFGVVAGNVNCPIDNDRFGWAGISFGQQQTHYWVYEWAP